MFHRQLVPLLASMLVSCASRPKPPPQDAIVPPPWGSIEWQDTGITTATAPAPGIDRAVLALAGAGSRCAYGAGLPQSITNSDPVTKDDSSEARYKTP